MHYKKYNHILSPHNGLNLYRGCTHGCIYCDSRSKCYKLNHEFTDIEVKEDALKILDSELKKKRNRVMISTGSMSDPYMPLENKLNLTHGMLELVLKYKMGVHLQTKSTMLLRDLDLLKQINQYSKVVISVTLTTYDETLCRILEPNVSTTKERFEMLKILNENGITCGVWLDPILPFINDNIENIKGILDYCLDARVKYILCFGMGLTLREGNREYFYEQLDRYFPGLKECYEYYYHNNYNVTSLKNAELMKYFLTFCDKHQIMHNPDKIFTYLGTFEDKIRTTLF